MNPYGNTNLNSRPGDGTEPGLASVSVPGSFHDLPSLSASPVIQTGRTFVSNSSAHQASSHKDGDQNQVPPPNSHHSSLSLPSSDSGINPRSRPQSSLEPAVRPSRSQSPVPIPTPNPYPAPNTAPASFQVSVIIPPADSYPLPSLTSQCSEESSPDLECSICFSQFNNVFRCPKMLRCKHTFCLECLARINVKSAEPSNIQCPLCRGLTPLPNLGLPKLTTDTNVLSYLPAAMQRVYSIRFLRNKGKLEVKRSTGSHQWRGQRPFTSLRPGNRFLDVGLPSPPLGGQRSEAGGVGGALFRLTSQPMCRAFLLTSVVLMMMLLMGIIIFITLRK